MKISTFKKIKKILKAGVTCGFIILSRQLCIALDQDEPTRNEIVELAKEPTEQNLMRIVEIIAASPERNPISNGTRSKMDYPAVTVLVRNGEKSVDAFLKAPALNSPQRASTCELYASFLNVLEGKFHSKQRLSESLQKEPANTPRHSNLAATLFYLDQPDVLSRDFLSFRKIFPPGRTDNNLPIIAPDNPERSSASASAEGPIAKPFTRITESVSSAQVESVSQGHGVILWLAAIVAALGGVWVLMRKGSR